MPGDAFYTSRRWRELRQAILERDGYRCVVPGCRARATRVDHIVHRQRGGTDASDNLRSLCAAHDNAVKEMANGARAQGGRLFLKDVNADGTPREPSHPWNRQ